MKKAKLSGSMKPGTADFEFECSACGKSFWLCEFEVPVVQLDYIPSTTIHVCEHCSEPLEVNPVVLVVKDYGKHVRKKARRSNEKKKKKNNREITASVAAASAIHLFTKSSVGRVGRSAVAEYKKFVRSEFYDEERGWTGTVQEIYARLGEVFIK